MQAYQFQQIVTPSHQITLVLPPDAPLGEAQITVLFPHTEAPNTPSKTRHPEFANIAEYLAWHDTQPASARSPEDVDRQIREERDGWND